MQADPVKVKRLLATARGQIDGLIKMVDEDRYCIDISHQILATQAILRKVNLTVLHAHLDHCVLDALNAEDPEARQAKIDEIAGILDKMSR